MLPFASAGMVHYTISSIPVVSAFIKPPTNPNPVHSVLAAEYQKETAEQPDLTVNLKLFDASSSRIAIRCVGELHAVRNLTQEVSITIIACSGV